MTNLELSESEATAEADLGVVLVGWATDNWTDQIHRAWSDLGGLSSTQLTAALGLLGLVEVALDEVLPLLVEVVVWDNVVAERHPACEDEVDQKKEHN